MSFCVAGVYPKQRRAGGKYCTHCYTSAVEPIQFISIGRQSFSTKRCESRSTLSPLLTHTHTRTCIGNPHGIPWHTMPPKGSGRGRTQHRDADKEPETPFHPAADAATFRDLLIFEERLKQNAARLQARKRKYEMLLFGFVSFILCLSHFVVISPRSSVFLQYSLAAVLMICLTTLFLFFASGMHAERIRSANKFVPQANRSLRNFNMYLNTRPARSAALGTSAGSTSSSSSLSSSIPPAQNSRGELIFSSRVSPDFRQGYERYRAAFERRRAEKMAAKRAQSWKRWFDFALGRSSEPATKPGSSVARQSVESRPRTTRSSKPRSSRASRTTRTDTASNAAAPCHVASGQLEDMSDAPSEGLSSEGLSDGMSDGMSEGVSEEGGSLSGHEPS